MYNDPNAAPQPRESRDQATLRTDTDPTLVNGHITLNNKDTPNDALDDQDAPHDQDTLDAATSLGEFIAGVPVFDRNGERVGTVSVHGALNNALVIHLGLPRDDVHIPLDAVESKGADGVYLSITRDEALSGNAVAGPDTAVTPAATAQDTLPPGARA